MKGIEGKTAIVTGAASGIGRAAAERFATEGANVLVADIDEEGGQETVERIKTTGGEATFARVDVSDSAQVEAMVDLAIDEYGSLDFAHNNAGVGGESAPVHEQPVENWDRMLGVNQRGIWLCMKHELPYVLEHEGAIVNTASLAGLWAAPNISPYITGKHGVVGLTKTAAMEYAEDGVRVNALCPGLVDTAFPPAGAVEKGIDITPMNRAADPDEVGAAAVWLCSDDASFVTGVAMPIDGGSIASRS